MIKANIVIQVKDGDNVYNVGDKVKCLMKPLAEHKGNYEYVGTILDIQETLMALDTGLELMLLRYNEILMIKPLSH